MNEREILNIIGIDSVGEYGDDGYVVSLLNSNEYGKVFSKLEKSDIIEIMQDNQVVTEQGSSLMYEVIDEPYVIDLNADFEGDVYELVITRVGE